MKDLMPVLYVSAALTAASILAACSNGSSPSTFAPSGATEPSIQRSESSAASRTSVTQYSLRTLPTLGGNQNVANAINDRSQITGSSFLKGNQVEHAVLWSGYRATDLGTLGGPDSTVNFYNHGTRGQFVGFSDVSQTDPYDENFCGFGTSNICLGFSWRHGKMTPLPTLSGNNTRANDENNRGQIVGGAETTTQDSSCLAPQVFDYFGVIWQPNGKVVTLPPLSGDTVTDAFSINRSGMVVGYSGPCTVLAHPLLWRDASPTYLGSLGGSYNNIAFDINNRTQIVGYSDLPGDTVTHGFLWQSGTMTDLGTLPGDLDSFALGINDKGQVVGQSCSASSCRGFIWQNGSMTDLNLLIPPNKNLYVYSGSDINVSGRIAAEAINQNGVGRAVVLIPGKKVDVLTTRVSAPKFTVPQSLRIRPRSARVAPTALRKFIFAR